MESNIEACCVIDVATQKAGPHAAICPVCGKRGKSVQIVTLQSLLLTDIRELNEQPFYFCRTPDCPVVYFDEHRNQVYTKDQVRVRIFQKDPAEDVLTCYCFKFSRKHIRAVTANKGSEWAPEYITQGVVEGKCACEITNPQGSCCLGNVRGVVKEFQETLQPA